MNLTNMNISCQIWLTVINIKWFIASSQYKCDIKQRYNIEDGKAVFIIPVV